MSSHLHQVTAHEIGQVRIYMTPGEKRQGGGMKGLFAKPLYQQVIDLAHGDRILNAIAHSAHYGYSGAAAPVQANDRELPNSQLSLCVELIAPRDQLELFCRKHGDVLAGKVVVYQTIERWEVGPRASPAAGPNEEHPDAAT